MPLTASPMVRRQRLGAELKALRLGKGLTGEQVADRLGWLSNSKVSRLELAQSRPNLADIMDMLDLYEVAGAKREELIAVARDAANITGWWRSVAGMHQRQRSCAELETGAAEIWEYTQFLIPGLLQTKAYATVRTNSGRELYPDLDPDVDAGARASRTDILSRADPPRYKAIVEEAALRRSVAPSVVMAGQLEQLAHLVQLPNVGLRVLPLSARVADFYVPHSSFSLYRFRDPGDPETVVLETLTSDVHLRDEEDVRLYKRIFGWMRDAALSEDASANMITTLVSQT